MSDEGDDSWWRLDSSDTLITYLILLCHWWQYLVVVIWLVDDACNGLSFVSNPNKNRYIVKKTWEGKN